MITNNLSTLKIHKLTQAQYDRELEAGRIDENALYLTPDSGVSWEDIENKPFSSETTYTTIIPSTTITLAEIPEEKSITETSVSETSVVTNPGAIDNPFIIDILNNVEYIVVWDNVEYRCKVYMEGWFISIGNSALSGSDLNLYTDLPFAVVQMRDGWNNRLRVMGEIGTHTISIIQLETKYDKLEANYVEMPCGKDETVLLFDKTVDSFNMPSEAALNEDEAAVASDVIYYASVPVRYFVPIELGDTLKITWDGIEYYRVAIEAEYETIGIGNCYLYNGGVDTGEPFYIGACMGEYLFLSNTSDSSHSIKIEKLHALKKLDAEYVPNFVVYHVSNSVLLDENGDVMTLTDAKKYGLDVLFNINENNPEFQRILVKPFAMEWNSTNCTSVQYYYINRGGEVQYAFAGELPPQ